MYEISEKENSSEISSDGEFINADKILILNEDDSFVNEIELKK